MNKQIFILFLTIFTFQQCHSPVKPITEETLEYSLINSFNTNGYALDVDIANDLIVLAANYDGTYLLDLIRDENGNITSINEREHLFDWEASIGDEKSNKVIIINNPNAALLSVSIVVNNNAIVVTTKVIFW